MCVLNIEEKPKSDSSSTRVINSTSELLKGPIRSRENIFCLWSNVTEILTWGVTLQEKQIIIPALFWRNAYTNFHS